MFEAFLQIAFLLNSGLSPFNSSQYRIRAIFSLSVHYEGTFSILCVNFSMQTQMTVMRNDSADDLARLGVANLYCEMHFQLLIPT
jgi:hypothetical protein